MVSFRRLREALYSAQVMREVSAQAPLAAMPDLARTHHTFKLTLDLGLWENLIVLPGLGVFHAPWGDITPSYPGNEIYDHDIVLTPKSSV